MSRNIPVKNENCASPRVNRTELPAAPFVRRAALTPASRTPRCRSRSIRTMLVRCAHHQARFAGRSTMWSLVKCCGANGSARCRWMSAGSRFTLRSSPSPVSTAKSCECCRCPGRKITISLMQGKGTIPLPCTPIPARKRRKNCQGCARSKMSGLPPATQCFKRLSIRPQPEKLIVASSHL
jgi:hypothetical protein